MLTDEQIALKEERATFWRDMRVHFLQEHVNINEQLAGAGSLRKPLKAVVPVAARVIFTETELNKTD